MATESDIGTEGTKMVIRTVTLKGRLVTLEPLRQRHAADIFGVLSDRELCRYLRWGPLKSVEEAAAVIAEAENQEATGQALPFAIVLNETGHAIGSTRLLDIRPADRQVEHGSTFLAKAFWGSAANVERSYLILRHCFDDLGCVRVATKMDVRNIRARAAAVRNGYVQEGILRRDRNIKGHQRDTIYYSILDNEWPAVRTGLLTQLQ